MVVMKKKKREEVGGWRYKYWKGQRARDTRRQCLLWVCLYDITGSRKRKHGGGALCATVKGSTSYPEGALGTQSGCMVTHSL